ncbi:MAG: TolB family protein [Gemmatimonadota bacterium]
MPEPTPVTMDDPPSSDPLSAEGRRHHDRRRAAMIAFVGGAALTTATAVLPPLGMADHDTSGISPLDGVRSSIPVSASTSTPASAPPDDLRERTQIAPDDWMNHTDGPAISPDGRHIAYSAGGGGWAGNTMYLHDLETGEARPLEGAEHGLFPFWSPDGRRLGFFVLVGPHFALRVLDLERGTARTVGEAPFLGMAMGATWTADDRIIHTGHDLALHEISLAACETDGDAAMGARDGQCPTRVLARPDTAAGEIGLLAPQTLPDARGLVYAVVHDDGSSRIVVRTGRPETRSGPSDARTLLEWSDGTPYFLALSPGGRLLFSAGAGLWAVPLSSDALSATGEPVLVRGRGYRPTVASGDGTLVYRVVRERDHQRLLLVDRAGNVIRRIGPGAERVLHPAFSPDGRRVAVYPVVAGNWDIRVYDIETGRGTRVTRDPRADFDMAWGPAADELIFTTFRRYPSTLGLAHVGGERPTRALDLEAADRSVFALWEPAVSPDGRWLAYYLVEPDGIDLWHEDLATDSPSRPLITGPGAEIHPVFSPDGRYLAYMHDEAGEYTVRVRRAPGASRAAAIADSGRSDRAPRRPAEWTLGGAGARYPKWSPAGDELFFVRRDTLFAVPVATDAGFRVAGSAEPLFTGEAVGSLLDGVNRNNPTYDVGGAGDRFAIVANRAGEGRAQLVVESDVTGVASPR